MVNMWKFLVFIAAVVVWPDSAIGQPEYLTTVDGWSFFKVRAVGAMTNMEVKVTCEAAGMRYPCYGPGGPGCTRSYWTSDCITYDVDAGGRCHTHWVLSEKLCGNTDPWHCQPLDDIFVYIPNWQSDDSACGVDYDTHTWCAPGADYNDMYALCAAPTCARWSPCVHGTCTDDNNGTYTCACENGWEGINCDQNIDDCLSSPCAHGTCTDGVASYTCSCENGWTGNNCDQDIDDCASSPCAHGTCTDGVASYTCSCENGWTGNNCDQDIDDCLSSPCAHGTCTDAYGEASYTCSCENGWTGNNCDQDIDECASNPCWLGGTCLDHVNGYSCVCPKDATGKNCETATFAGECYQFSSISLTHQEATQACSTNGGRMVDLKDEQQQLFLADKIATTSAASSWLAMKAAPVAFFYSNGSPFSGQIQWSSSEPAEPCDLCVLLDSSDNYLAKTAPCTEQHNYVCQDDFDWCSQAQCPQGWVCQDFTFYFVCVHPDPVTNRMAAYQCSSASCPDGMYCTEEGVASFSCKAV